MKTALALLVVLGTTGRASAAKTDAATSASFLKLPVGARNTALGATGAADGGVQALYWNPAGLQSVEGREAAYSYSSWLAGTSHHFAGFAQKTSAGVFGVWLQYVAVPGIDKFDNTGAPVGQKYSPLDGLIALSYARAVLGVDVGASLKSVYSKLEDHSARTTAVDLGARYSLMEGKLKAGASVQNIGPGLKYAQERAPLPRNLKAGLSFHPAAGVTICGDVNAPRDAELWAGAGAEYMAAVGKGAKAGPRLGYQTGRQDLGGLAGLNLGLGLVVQKLSFDYAFVPMGDAGDTHRLSLGARF